MFKQFAVLLMCLLPAGLSYAQQKPSELRFCHEDQDSYPYVFKDKPGTNVRMMQILEKQLAVTIHIQVMPWKRCLHELKEGRIDGAFPASFRADRIEFGQYPMLGGQPDVSKRLHTSGYALYRLKGSTVDWDGSKIVHAKRPIGAQFGFSIVDTLKQAGAEVDDGAKSADDTLRHLLAGDIDGAALQPTTGDNLLESRAYLKQKIERVRTSIEEKPYYLMLSHKTVKQYPEFSKQVWNAITTIRESAEFKKIEAEY